MLLADVLFLVIVVYLAYRFIFNFLLPIVKATHHVRQQFRDARGDGNVDEKKGAEKRSYKPPAEDYIDFEEVKK